MDRNILYVVGNKYFLFTKKIAAVTVAEFLELTEAHFDTLDQIVICQGVSSADMQKIHGRIADYVEDSRIDLVEYVSAKVAKERVHKRHDFNVMVSEPSCVDEGTYEANMIIDDDCSDMADHVTGIHVQGSLFTEAARQMFMASSHHYVQNISETKLVYTLQKVNVAFKGFLYPLPITMRLRILSSKNIRGILSGEAEVQFIQGNRVGVELTFKARAYAPSTLKQVEEARALEVVSKMDEWLQGGRLSTAACA